MKTVTEIRREIIESMKLGSPEQTVYMLNNVYRMESFLSDSHIFLVEEDLQFTIEGFSQTITHIINKADRQELLENYSQLTGQEWEWYMEMDESDCHPEWLLRNKS